MSFSVTAGGGRFVSKRDLLLQIGFEVYKGLGGLHTLNGIPESTATAWKTKGKLDLYQDGRMSGACMIAIGSIGCWGYVTFYRGSVMGMMG